MNSQGILIVGGYGVVGRRVATELASEYPGQVLIGGRNPAQAQAIASTIGNGVRGRKIDIAVPPSIAAALEGVGVVISCIDQPDRALLWAAIERGLRYTDITPHLTELGRDAGFDKVEAAAKRYGARVVLGTGIVPGISNVLVRALADTLDAVDQIETALLLDANDAKGPASLDYFLQELSMSFNVWVDGKDRLARAFSAPRFVEFPPPMGTHLAYLFPFSDQVLYPRTMGVKTALTRVAISPPWLARVLAGMVRVGAAGLIASEGFRHFIARLGRDRAPSKEAQFALRVDVRYGARTRRATLVGKAQADAAAAGAAEVARLLIDDDVVEPGAWMPEQIVDPGPFLSRLASRGLSAKLD